jgi:hypothetical protein
MLCDFLPSRSVGHDGMSFRTRRQVKRTAVHKMTHWFTLFYRTDGILPSCNVMRILRLDVTAITACNARRMVRSDPWACGFFLEHKGFGLGSQYTFGRLSACVRVWTCVREQGKLKRGMKRDH